MQPAQIYQMMKIILVDQTYNSKKENFDAANYNVPNVPIYSQALFLKYEEDRYGNLSSISPHLSSNPMKASVQLTCGQKKINAVLWKVKPMIWKEITYGLNQENFL